MNTRTSATEKMLAEEVYKTMLRGCYHTQKTKYLGCEYCYDLLNSLIVFAHEDSEVGVNVTDLAKNSPDTTTKASQSRQIKEQQ